jgi:hypothetical protein
MTTKVKAPSRTRTAAPPTGGWALVSPWPTPPWTAEERLRRIEVMGQQIIGYIRFMCEVGSLNGISAEAKERALTAFYERMIVVESQLGRIQEDLRLE